VKTLLLCAGLVIAFTTQAATSTGSLAAVVVADDAYKTPLAAADVTLTSADDRTGDGFQRSMVAGDDGTCVFDAVPPGRYVLRASSPEFVTTAFGATPDDTEPVPIVVTVGRRTTSIEIKLPPGGAISGVVRNARGAPAAHVTVSLMEFVGESRRVAKMSDAAGIGAVVRTETDQQGAYRLHGLPRGRYLVQATSAEPGPAVTMSRGYFPGARDPSGASEVDVSQGQNVTGIDVQMQPLSLVDVSGSVAWPTTQPRPNLKILMFPEGLFDGATSEQDGQIVIESPAGMFSNPVSVSADNSFNIRGVPAGQYELWLRSVPANLLAPDDPGPAIWGHTSFGVDSRDLSGVVIEPHLSSTINGRVIVDAIGAAVDKQALASASVVLAPTEMPGLRSRALRVPAPIQADGAFHIVGVTPGRYRLEVSVPSPTWSLASVKAGTRDLFEIPFEIAPDDVFDDVVVTLATARQMVTGTLLDRDSHPVGGIRVVVFPADRARWQRESRRIRSVKTATDGTFSVTDLPVGEYRLGAITTSLDASRLDSAVLNAIVPASVPVSLGRGERRTIDLRISR